MKNKNSAPEIQGRPEIFFTGEWRIISGLSIDRFKADLICKYFGFNSGFLKITGIKKNLEKAKIQHLFNLICPKNVSLLNECTVKKSGLLTT